MKSNLKWRLHDPRNLLETPGQAPGFSKTNLEGCFKSAGLKIRTYDEEVFIGDFGDHRIPMFLAVGEPA